MCFLEVRFDLLSLSCGVTSHLTFDLPSVLTPCLSPYSPPDLTPEEKARGVARAIRKQTGEVRERWERLRGHVGAWQIQVERALERLQELQSSMDQLDLRLARAEETKAEWQPVGDLLIDSLQDHIEKTVVRLLSSSYFSCLNLSNWARAPGEERCGLLPRKAWVRPSQREQ